jgi:AcrR family transcriptional regulator
MLGQYLAKFREIAQQLLEAQQLAQPTEAIEKSLLNHLTAYMWTVRNRALLLLAAADSITDEQQAEQLLTRLSVVEALVGLRRGKLPELPVEPTTDLHSLHALLQRLVAAESRLFHLFGIAPLN